MKKQYKVSIPKPCHEDWSKMTPKEKGRFCGSCSKTVIDFTKKSKEEIQQYLSENFGKRVCGHFNRRQLDTITIEIPSTTFEQQLSFQKLFILALLFVMGTTLFSCQYSDGKKQKIEDVIVIDSLQKDIDSVLNEECNTLTDKTTKTIGKLPSLVSSTYTAVGVTVVTGKTLPLKFDKSFHLDSIIEIEEEEEIIEDILITGETIEEPEEIEGELELTTVGFIINEPPRILGTNHLSRSDAKTIFNQKMIELFTKEFKAPQSSIDIKPGTYRIIILFTIDNKGNIADVKIKAPHKTFEKEARRVSQMVPKFIPGEQAGKPIRTKFTLPLRIEVE